MAPKAMKLKSKSSMKKVRTMGSVRVMKSKRSVKAIRKFVTPMKVKTMKAKKSVKKDDLPKTLYIGGQPVDPRYPIFGIQLGNDDIRRVPPHVGVDFAAARAPRVGPLDVTDEP